jgi:hypothetical protein
MTYDFTTLSLEDFELPVANVLGKELGTLLETFKSGKDQGIGLRHSRLLPGATASADSVQALRTGKFRLVTPLSHKRDPKL